MSVQGVYIIKNTKTCDGYVGASVKVYERWAAHKRSLDKDKHYNPLLQAAWNHYGPEIFILEVIEAVPLREQLVTREQYHIDELHPAYNLRRTAIRIPVRTIWRRTDRRRTVLEKGGAAAGGLLGVEGQYQQQGLRARQDCWKDIPGTSPSFCLDTLRRHSGWNVCVPLVR